MPSSDSPCRRSSAPASRSGAFPGESVGETGGTIPNVAEQQIPDLTGPNSWMVDEMYESYLDDPTSVSEAWRDFFADYKRDIDSEPAEPVTSVADSPATAPAPAKGKPAAKDEKKKPVADEDVPGEPIRGVGARSVRVTRSARTLRLPVRAGAGACLRLGGGLRGRRCGRRVGDGRDRFDRFTVDVTLVVGEEVTPCLAHRGRVVEVRLVHLVDHPRVRAGEVRDLLFSHVPDRTAGLPARFTGECTTAPGTGSRPSAWRVR